MAYGPLKLKPHEFERLQPHEFEKLIEGYRWRQEHQEDMTAYFVAMILNASGKVVKKTISPRDLVAPLRKAAPKKNKKQDEEYLKEAFRGKLGGG